MMASPDTFQFEKRWAIFQPLRTDDLQDGVVEFVGTVVHVQATHVLEHGSLYDGQWAWMPIPPDGPVVAWIPDCDLVFDPVED